MERHQSTSAPASLSAKAMSYLTLLLNIIEGQDWNTFDRIAIQNPKAFQSLSQIISSTEEFNGMTFLHTIVRNRAPVQVVADVIRICPDSPRACDCLNRTPLHVAAGIGASDEVVEELCTAYPEACKIQDEDGKTPLHFACDVECTLFDGQQERRDPPTFEVIRTLLCESIAPASTEDDDGVNPLEYAIFSNADLRVVRLLQKAVQRQTRNLHALKEKQARPTYERRSSWDHRLQSASARGNKFAYC